MPEARDPDNDLLSRIAGSPRDPSGRGLVQVAEQHRREGRLDAALEVLAGVDDALRAYTPRHLVEARVRRARGEVAEARVSFGRALALDPHNREALEALAELADLEGDGEEARRHRRSSHALATWLEAPLGGYGARPGEGEEEAPLSLDALATEIPPPRAHAPLPGLGDPEEFFAGLDSIGTTLEAEEEAEEEPESEGEETELYSETLAELYARQGDPERAASVLTHLLEGHPERERLEARIEELQAATLAPAVQPDPDHELIAEEMSDRAGAAHPEVGETPFAWPDDPAVGVVPAAEGTPIGAYLERLLAWAPAGPRELPIVPIESLAPDELRGEA